VHTHLPAITNQGVRDETPSATHNVVATAYGAERVNFYINRGGRITWKAWQAER
jgi:hypothetical protein